jgi:hypothetical protein
VELAESGSVIMKTRQPRGTRAAAVRERLSAWEPGIGAFVTLDETGFARLDAADGPLSGLAVGVKDVLDVAGLPTRNGSRACNDAAPAINDAPVVAALRAAGAAILGKTVTTEFAFIDPTDCRNPFDTARTPGGSSSGSGAAVGAGALDLALGTQTAGSLCRPAAYCGAVGLKPGHGVLSTVRDDPTCAQLRRARLHRPRRGHGRGGLRCLHGFLTVAGSAGRPAAGPRTRSTPTHRCPHRRLTALNGAEAALSALGMTAKPGKTGLSFAAIVADHRTVMLAEAATAHGSCWTVPATTCAPVSLPRWPREGNSPRPRSTPRAPVSPRPVRGSGMRCPASTCCWPARAGWRTAARSGHRLSESPDALDGVRRPPASASLGA